MTDEETKEQLWNMLFNNFRSEEKDKEALEMAIKALERNRWIPINEGYPKEEDEYKEFLVQDEHEKIDVEKIYYTIPTKEVPIRTPYFSGMRKIVAWKPLPTRYKTEGK